jgi:hypothetical protein
LKKLGTFAVILAVISLTLALASPVLAGGKPVDSIKIQDGLLEYPGGYYLAGQPLETGTDGYGYNYQAHSFNGNFVNFVIGWPFTGTDGNYYDGLPPYTGDDAAYLAAYPQAALNPYWPYRDLKLNMKWSESYFSNRGSQPGGFVDVSGFQRDSGAWVTNHISGTYIGEDGKTHRWINFIKLVAPPEGAYHVDGVWYIADGTELGLYDGGAVMTQLVVNDPYADDHGLAYKSPVSPGLGFYAPQ